MLLGSAHIKAARRMLVKLTPCNKSKKQVRETDVQVRKKVRSKDKQHVGVVEREANAFFTYIILSELKLIKYQSLFDPSK